MKKAMYLVEIRFQDHSSMIGGEADVMNCRVWGVLYKETKDAYYVCSWALEGPWDAVNNDTYAIRKHPGVVCRKITKVS